MIKKKTAKGNSKTVATAKKPAAKKTTAKKTAAKTPAKVSTAKTAVKKPVVRDAAHKTLATELRTHIPKLDSEGLSFLVGQAKIHRYNMKVMELNQAARTATVRKVMMKKAAVQKSPDGLSIVKNDGGYALCFRGNESNFSRDEMIRLVKLASASGTASKTCEQLFGWLNTERKDFFDTFPITGPNDKQLAVLAALIKKHFKLRKGD
jgi:hypothetical protein